MLRNRVALIDPSWSNTYVQYGAHFNRVVIDALICGAVPIMRDWGDPTSPLRPWIHYVPLPATEEGPKAQAKAIDSVVTQDWSDWMPKAREILPLFDCKRAAKIFLELAEGRGDTKGRSSISFTAQGKAAMESFFAAG
jgi:hypothetical protein